MLARVLYGQQGHLLFRRIITTPVRPTYLAGRGTVQGLSESASGRMRRYLRSCRANYRVFITATYPGCYPMDGRVVKRHLDNLLKRLRYHVRTNDGSKSEDEFSAFWFLEFQARGAPHIHLFSTHSFNKDWLSQIWYEIVDSGDERHLYAGTRIEWLRSGRGGTVSYASKYASKQQQKTVPANFANVGRFWGVYGLRTVYAASIVFRVDFGENRGKKAVLEPLGSKNTLFDEFRRELSRFIRDAGEGIVYLGDKHSPNGIIFTDEWRIKDLHILFSRYGLMATLDPGVYYSNPLIDAPEDLML